MSTAGRRRAGALLLGLLGAAASVDGAAQEPDELLTAAMYDEIAVVKDLLAAGADIDQQNEHGQTALILAANYGYEELARLLVSEGADVGVRARDGATALIAAASRSRPLVELLLEHGADVDARMDNGTGVFTQCTVGILTGRVTLELARLLLAAGAQVDEAATAGSHQGYTPLMMAARNGHEPLVRFLIENGADVGAEAGDGSTPLSLAEAEGRGSIVAILEAAAGG